MITGLNRYDRFWHPAGLVISQMERHGLQLSLTECRRAVDLVRGNREALEVTLTDWTGPMNWGSVQQLKELLYYDLGLPVPPVCGTLRAIKATKRDEYPTSEVALHHLADHAADPDVRQGLRLLLDWRAYRRLEGFYESLPSHAGADGRIHTQLFPATETGRLTSKNPNLQQLPNDKQGVSPAVEAAFREFRACIVPAPGYVLLCLDYDALEWRILAHVLAHRYGDTSLVDEILAGVNPHSATAVAMGLCPGPVQTVKERDKHAYDAAKILNYSINYGKTPQGLGIQIRDEHGDAVGPQRGRELHRGFYEARPGVGRFHEDIVKYARAHGYVRSLLGRHRYLDFSGKYTTKAERQAKNVIQNCAADVMICAMLKCNPAPLPDLVSKGWFNPLLHRMGVRQLLNIHDELLFEVPEEHAEGARALVADEMAHALDGVREFKCPLSVSGGYGYSWKEAK